MCMCVCIFEYIRVYFYLQTLKIVLQLLHVHHNRISLLCALVKQKLGQVQQREALILSFSTLADGRFDSLSHPPNVAPILKGAMTLLFLSYSFCLLPSPFLSFFLNYRKKMHKCDYVAGLGRKIVKWIVAQYT